MVKKLAELGRIDWLKHDFAELTKIRSFILYIPKKLVLKLKGKNTNRKTAVHYSNPGAMARKNGNSPKIVPKAGYCVMKCF